MLLLDVIAEPWLSPKTTTHRTRDIRGIHFNAWKNDKKKNHMHLLGWFRGGYKLQLTETEVDRLIYGLMSVSHSYTIFLISLYLFCLWLFFLSFTKHNRINITIQWLHIFLSKNEKLFVFPSMTFILVDFILFLKFFLLRSVVYFYRLNCPRRSNGLATKLSYIIFIYLLILLLFYIFSLTTSTTRLFFFYGRFSFSHIFQFLQYRRSGVRVSLFLSFMATEHFCLFFLSVFLVDKCHSEWEKVLCCRQFWNKCKERALEVFIEITSESLNRSFTVVLYVYANVSNRLGLVRSDRTGSISDLRIFWKTSILCEWPTFPHLSLWWIYLLLYI